MWAGAREGGHWHPGQGHAGVASVAPRGQGGATKDDDDDDLPLDELTSRSARGSLATTSTNVTLTSRLLQGLPRFLPPQPAPAHCAQPRPPACLYPHPFHSFPGAFPGLPCRGGAGGRLRPFPRPKPPPPRRLRVLPPRASALHPGRLETASLLLAFTYVLEGRRPRAPFLDSLLERPLPVRVSRSHPRGSCTLDAFP